MNNERLSTRVRRVGAAKFYLFNANFPLLLTKLDPNQTVFAFVLSKLLVF